jgi:mannose-6-phosphate isomerase
MNSELQANAHTWRLFSQIRHYAWGTCNQQAFIPKLLGIAIEPDLPYAELWIGDNPSAPSTAVPHGQRGYKVRDPLTLDQLIQSNPEILGQGVLDRWGARLPFLAKVLSVGDNLSIQVHPDSEQAKILHQRQPEHYPDPYHKPEIAIAIDRVQALAGFRPLSEMKELIHSYPEIVQLAGNDLSEQLLEVTDIHDVPHCFSKWFTALCLTALENPDLWVQQVAILSDRLQELSLVRKLDAHEQLFLYLRSRYGSDDPGLFLLFVLNYVEIKPGEALLIPPGLPHAYLQGNLFEVMACSDNVVRAGLTPKHRDLKTLVEISIPHLSVPLVYRPRAVHAHVEYPVFADEFSIERIHLQMGAGVHLYHPATTYLVYFVEGRADIKFKRGSDWIIEDYKHSHCVLIPANFGPIEVRARDEALFFVIKVPEERLT